MPKKKTVYHKKLKEIPYKGPQYMVQVNEPKMVRRDVLESLRDIILFMQGYEKFRKVQEEKVILFTRLKAQVKELSMILQNKIYLYFPKGQLQAVTPPGETEEETDEEPEQEIKAPPLKPVRTMPQKVVGTPRDDLEDLEMQLKDIEKQLQGIE